MAPQPTKPKVVLHVGAHKTGTSTFQKFMREYRDLTERSGVAYLHGFDAKHPDQRTHNYLAACLASGAPEQAKRAREHLLPQIAPREGIHTVVASSEEFNRYVLGEPGLYDIKAQAAIAHHYLAGDEHYWARRALFLDLLADILSDHEVEIWITLRRPDNFCMSMYQQTIRNRAYVGSMSDFAASDFALFQYARLLDQWSARFRLRVFVYEDLMAEYGDTALPYLNALGVRDHEPTVSSFERVNIASHPHVIEFMRRTNYFPLRKPDLRRGLGRIDFEACGMGGPKESALMSRRDRAAFNDRFAEQCEEVRSRYDVATPGRETLFDFQIDDDRPVYSGMDQETFEWIARQISENPRLYP